MSKKNESPVMAMLASDPAPFGTVVYTAQPITTDVKEASKPSVLPAPEPGILLHVLQKDDTLFQLALRYGSTAEDISRANALLTTDLDLLPLHCILRIPLNTEAAKPPKSLEDTGRDIDEEAKKKRFMVREFCGMHQITAEEARFYLEDNDWNAASASKAVNVDDEWEKAHIKEMKNHVRIIKSKKSHRNVKKGLFGLFSLF